MQEHFFGGYFYKGLDCIIECLRDTNAFMQFNKPWELAKQKEDMSKKKLSTILHVVLEVLRISGTLLQPIIPALSTKLLDKLQISSSERTWKNISCFQSYYNVPNSYEGRQFGNVQLPLYGRKIASYKTSETR